MPIYSYTAISKPGQTIQADIEADSEQDAINKINRQGYFPIQVKAGHLAQDNDSGLKPRKISNKDIVLFTRQLSNLIGSGINLLNAINIISDQAQNKYLKAVLSDITGKIKDGRPFSESLSAHPAIFSGLYHSMIHSGEVGGNIAQELKRLADFLEKEEELRSSIRAALTYPIFIISVSIITVIILLGFVIPRLVGMFSDMGQALPLPTQIIIGLSGFLQAYWWLILAVILISVFLIRRFYSQPRGRMSIDRLKTKIPVLGAIILKTEISRLTRTLSLLLASGIPIIYALDTAVSVVKNQVLRKEAEQLKGRISSGMSLSGALKKSGLFSAFVTNIVGIGEETGSLEKSLMNIAEDYEKEADRSLKALTRLLEPVIILIMGLVVGFIVLSMLLPIFQINLTVR